MGGHRPTYRTIREDHTYAYCIRELRLRQHVDDRHLDDLTGHLRWRLARDPFERSFRLRGRQTRITFTEELPGVPVFRVFFYVESENVVVLTWIEAVDDAEPFGFDDFLDS